MYELSNIPVRAKPALKRQALFQERERLVDALHGIRAEDGVAHELPTHYDLVINTDRLSTERAVETIANASLM